MDEEKKSVDAVDQSVLDSVNQKGIDTVVTDFRPKKRESEGWAVDRGRLVWPANPVCTEAQIRVQSRGKEPAF